MTQPDPITMLLRLRGEMMHFSYAVDMLADMRIGREGKATAESIARGMRDAAMANDAVAACEQPMIAAIKQEKTMEELLVEKNYWSEQIRDAPGFASAAAADEALRDVEQQIAIKTQNIKE